MHSRHWMALNVETQRDSIQPGGQHPHFALHRVFQNSELRLDSGGWRWLDMVGLLRIRRIRGCSNTNFQDEFQHKNVKWYCRNLYNICVCVLASVYVCARVCACVCKLSIDALKCTLFYIHYISAYKSPISASNMPFPDALIAHSPDTTIGLW